MSSVQQIIDAIKSNEYVQGTLTFQEDALSTAVRMRRREEPWGLLRALNVSNPTMEDTTIVLIGTKGTNTGFHVDRAAAYNTGVPIVWVSIVLVCTFACELTMEMDMQYRKGMICPGTMKFLRCGSCCRPWQTWIGSIKS